MVEMPILAIVFTTPLIGGLDVFLDGRLVVGLLQQTFVDQVFNRLVGEIRIDGAAAVADEQREMMHFARFAGFQHETGACRACRCE